METIRIRLEGISQMKYIDEVVKCPSYLQLNYGSIMHYTRRNPKFPNEIIPRYKWMRVISPSMKNKFPNPSFTEIISKDYGNDQLYAEVDTVPRVFEDIHI